MLRPTLKTLCIDTIVEKLAQHQHVFQSHEWCADTVTASGHVIASHWLRVTLSRISLSSARLGRIILRIRPQTVD